MERIRKNKRKPGTRYSVVGIGLIPANLTALISKLHAMALMNRAGDINSDCLDDGSHKGGEEMKR